MRAQRGHMGITYIETKEASLEKVIGFLGDRVMLLETGERDVFINQEGQLVAFSKDDARHPDNLKEE